MIGSLLIKKGGQTIPHLFGAEATRMAEQCSPSVDASPATRWDCSEAWEHFLLNFWYLFMKVLVCDGDIPAPSRRPGLAQCFHINHTRGSFSKSFSDHLGLSISARVYIGVSFRINCLSAELKIS